MMPEEVNSNVTKQPISNSENINERNAWKEFYYRDGKHEANIDNINRQLSVMSTDIDSVKTKISELTVELRTDKGWIKGFSIATFFAFLGLIISMVKITK
jgi:hypothetical protein